MKKKLQVSFIGLFISSVLSAQVPQLWGTTAIGGTFNSGKLYKINGDGTGYTMLHSFAAGTGSEPNGTFILAGDGKFYGTTSEGGLNNAGVIYSFNPGNNDYVVLFDFNGTNGYKASDEFVVASNGLYYATTQYGGNNNYGVLYSFDHVNNTQTKLHDFAFGTGVQPYGGLTQASDGKLYGVALAGGLYDKGVIFSFDIISNVYNNVYDFDVTTGSYPWAGLAQYSANSKLYSGTSGGGTNGKGTIFSLDISNNSFSVVFNFTNTTGDAFGGTFLELSNGEFYGTTCYGGGNGNIISFNPQNNNCNNLYNMIGSDGATPVDKFIQASDGNLYGTASEGGTNGDGTIFKFDPSNNSFIKIFEFNGNNGSIPLPGLIEFTITDIPENYFENNLQISPNPFTDELTITTSHPTAKAEIKIQDIYGRLVYEQKPATVNRKLQTLNWQKGIYFVEVITEEGGLVKKIVKQ